MEKLIDAGRIINTMGVKGAVKIEPWADSPEFLLRFKTFYIDGMPVAVRSSRVVRGRFVQVFFEGIDTPEKADALRGKVIYADRREAGLEEGQYFIQDLIGFDALDGDGRPLGKVADIMEMPGGRLLVIRGGREILVPMVDAFILGRDMEAGTVTVNMMEGL